MRIDKDRPFEERRQAIASMLGFINDFCRLDVALLIERTERVEFVESAEAVMESAVGAWRSMEALRDFCVHQLTGEKPPPMLPTDRIRPREMTPYSVPFELLRAMAPRPSTFTQKDLSVLCLAEACSVAPSPENKVAMTFRMPHNECWLITSLQARVLPDPAPFRAMKLWFTDLARNLYMNGGNNDGISMWRILDTPMPLFEFISASGQLELRLQVKYPPEYWNKLTEAHVMFVIEGWRYAVR